MPYAFGNLVTDFVQVLKGTNGYVIVVDTSADAPGFCYQVQMNNTTSGNVGSQPITSPTPYAQLLGLSEVSSPPPMAWTQVGNLVYVYLTTADYPFTSVSHIAFWILRNANMLTQDSDLLDIPPQARELLKSLTQQYAGRALGVRDDFSVTQAIISQKQRLNLT